MHAHPALDQPSYAPSMGALWVAKHSTFFQAENQDSADAQTDLTHTNLDRMLDDNYLRARLTIMYKNGLSQKARIAKRADQHENKTSEIE